MNDEFQPVTRRPLFQADVVELAGLEECSDGALQIAVVGRLMGRQAGGAQNL